MLEGSREVGNPLALLLLAGSSFRTDRSNFCEEFPTLELSEARLNIKTVFPGYEDSHVKNKTVVRPG